MGGRLASESAPDIRVLVAIFEIAAKHSVCSPSAGRRDKRNRLQVTPIWLERG
jgi:hypothetical protein